MPLGGAFSMLRAEANGGGPMPPLSQFEPEADMSEQAVHDWIRKQISSHDVVLFMKGNKNFPQCGFSGQVDQILRYLGVDYQDVNVLEDMGIREGIKSFSEWPTIPQLYVKGEFVGGCDIVREMFQAGELQEMFAEKGVKHTAVA